MDSLRRDLAYALRMLVKRPLMTVAAVLCLALGIGATTVVFSLVSAVLLKPLDYREPDRVVMLWNDFQQQGLSKAQVSGHEYLDFRDRNQVFSEVGGVVPWFYNLTSEEEPVRLVGGRATGNFFSMLGVEAAVGRTFTPEEEAADAKVIVLTHEAWHRLFGGDPGIVGRVVALDEIPYTVIGVLPPRIYLPFNLADVWVPWRPALRFGREQRGVIAVARMKPGVTLAQAQGDMDSLARQLRQEYPEIYPGEEGWRIRVGRVREEIVGDSRPRLLLLFGAVLLVLLIACANVANLLLAQATVREKEMALRASLGAGRGQLGRQLLTESFVLAGLGGLVGLLLAAWGVGSVASLRLGRLGEIPRLEEVTIDWRVLAFTLAVTFLTTLVFGGVPALRAARVDLVGVLKEGGRSAAAGGRHVLRSALVVAEIALALTVLVGTGLMLRSYQRLESIDPGFRTENVLIAQAYLPFTKYRTDALKREFGRRVLERLPPGGEIRDVALISHLPLYGIDFRGTVRAEGREPAPGEVNPTVGLRNVSPAYFQAYGIPVLRGRAFDGRDVEESEPAVVVDAALARRLWDGEDPIGRRLMVDGPPPWGGVWRTVVGVVDQVQHINLSDPPQEQLYVPWDQLPSPIVGLVVRTRGDPMAAVPRLRQAVAAVDPLLPVDSVQSADKLVDGWLAQPRFNIVLLALFGTVALILATVGVYGVMAYSVTQRRGEIGVRMAFGARRGDIVRLVVAQGMALATGGLVLGLGLTAVLVGALRRVWSDMLYGGSANDLATYVLVPLLLAGVALLATLLPARRATRVDPMIALRQE